MANDCFNTMLSRRVRTDGFIDPCIPTGLHEIKHDGYRLIVRRDGKAVRLFTRRGHDWTHRYPSIAAGARKIRIMAIGVSRVSSASVSPRQLRRKCHFLNRETHHEPTEPP
jgi:ATP dependent DNA ligase domain